jgi:Asp-tRNA(Asn)/Glu-tRNA(Gln) amidotransferase C subunit/outer membrane protein OmpA-like peptidoglycan-associated protein
VAAVLTDGLLGSVFIQIRSGSAEAPTVEDGHRIRGVDAVEIADLIAEGRETFRTVGEEFIGLQDQMSVALDALVEPITVTTELVATVRADVETITGTAAEVTQHARALLEETRAIVEALASGESTLGQLLGDDSLYQGLAGTVQETEATMRAVRRSAEEVEQLVDRLGGPEGDGTRLLADAAEAAALARNAMEDVAENTEALKRSWPFSGFFADRGFYNLDQLTRDEYRELFRDDRYTPLRIWVEGDLLFETDGQERITLAASAVARLDEAMAGLLAYPRDSPIVVEGYAAGGGAGLAYRQSQARADLVRSYLARAYRRAASLTGAMPMGSAAEGSPSRDGRWDGVALTMFVDTDRLRGERPASAVTQ